jgi:hypothetical protein
VSDPTKIPDSFRAGESISWTRTHADYPADDGWELETVFVGPGAKVEEDGTPTGKSFAFTLTTTESAAMAAGRWQWSERAKKGSVVKVTDGGFVIVLPDLFAATSGQHQSWNEKRLAKLDEIITARESNAMTAELEQWAIDNRLGRRPDLEALYALRSKCARAVAREQGRARVVHHREVRFTSPDSRP